MESMSSPVDIQRNRERLAWFSDEELLVEIERRRSLREDGPTFTCPKCGSHYWATKNHCAPFTEWIGYCKGGRYGEQPTLCDFEWPRTDDLRYGLLDSDVLSVERTVREPV